MPRYHLAHPSLVELVPVAVLVLWMAIALGTGKMLVFSRTKGPLIYDRKTDWPDFWLGMYVGFVMLLVGVVVTIASHISKEPQPTPSNVQAIPAQDR